MAENKGGLDRKLSADTIWLLNRDAIAGRYGCSPVEVENWPSFEVAIALKLLDIRAKAEKRKPRRK